MQRDCDIGTLIAVAMAIVTVVILSHPEITDAVVSEYVPAVVRLRPPKL